MTSFASTAVEFIISAILGIFRIFFFAFTIYYPIAVSVGIEALCELYLWCVTLGSIRMIVDTESLCDVRVQIGRATCLLNSSGFELHKYIFGDLCKAVFE